MQQQKHLTLSNREQTEFTFVYPDAGKKKEICLSVNLAAIVSANGKSIWRGILAFSSYACKLDSPAKIRNNKIINWHYQRFGLEFVIFGCLTADTSPTFAVQIV